MASPICKDSAIMSATSPHRARLVAGLLVVGVLLAVSSGAVPSGAQSSTETCANAQRIAGQVAELQDERMDLSARAETANYELSKLEDQVAEAEDDAAEAQAEADQARTELRVYSVGAYVSGNGISSFDAIVRSEPDTAPQRQGYMQAAAGNGRDVIDRASGAEAKATESVQTLEGLQGEAEDKAAELDDARDRAEAAEASQEALYDEVQSECVALVNAEAARIAAAAAEAQAAAAATSTTAAGGGPAGTAAATGTTAGPAPTTGGGATAPAPAPARAPAPAPSPAPAPAPAPPPSSSGAAAAIPYATSKVGSPYVWGAEGPNAFDCSGLMVWAFRQIGISLPHYSGSQYAMTTRVSRAQLAPGDLVFWGGGGSEHVALYMGGNQIVHAFGSAGGTRITHLDGWWKAPSGYGRL
jgi:peptidoglycan DL-endopeptidase CwlO